MQFARLAGARGRQVPAQAVVPRIITMSFKLKNLTSLQYRNVLIADDDKTIHEIYEEILRPVDDSPSTNVKGGEVMVDAPKEVYNFNVIHAYDGKEALDRAKQQEAHHLPVQMAIIDLQMPEWDGFETIRQLNEFDPRISFVIVTGYAEQARREISDRLGAMPVKIIEKPFVLQDLYDNVYSLVVRWNRIHAD